MSNRTLLEFNHDLSYRIEEEPAQFLLAIGDMMRGGPSDRNRAALERYGVKWYGQRHHSQGFDINWGGHKTSEPETR